MQIRLLAAKPDKLIKRSVAAQMCGVLPRTLRRWELSGALQPVKLNCRLTCYRAADLARIMAGEVETVLPTPSAVSAPRTMHGSFAPGEGKDAL